MQAPVPPNFHRNLKSPAVPDILATMKNGKPNGILTQFDEKGDMCSQTEMLDGNPRYDYYILSNKDGFGGKEALFFLCPR